jgi:UDP-glucose 4-epimerase
VRHISKALVTGGAGFIGSHIVDELASMDIDTYIIDDLSTGSLDNLARHKDSDNVHIIRGDARDVDLHLKGIGIDVVFHEAAIASVPRSVSHPTLVHDANVNTSLTILNYCVKTGVKRLIFASTAAVYGVIEGRAVEDMVCRPASPYGASKLSIEDYLHAYRQSYGLEAVALRYFNVYGSRQRFSDYSGVITVFANRVRNGQSPIIYGDGSQVRDFVHVDDIVQANILAMESAAAVGESFNVASGNGTSILELSRMIKRIMGTPDLPNIAAPARPGDTKVGIASIDKIISRLGYQPRIGMEKGLAGVIESIKRIQVAQARIGEVI